MGCALLLLLRLVAQHLLLGYRLLFLPFGLNLVEDLHVVAERPSAFLLGAVSRFLGYLRFLLDMTFLFLFLAILHISAERVARVVLLLGKATSIPKHK